MATLTNFLVMSFIVAFIIDLGYSSPTLQYTGIGQQANASLGNFTTSISSLQNAFNGTTIGVGSFSVTLPFPNPFSLFKGVFDLLISTVSMPVNTYSALDLPPIIKLGALVFLIYGIIKIISWFKGEAS